MACAVFGAITSVDSAENVGLACKATGFMTNRGGGEQTLLWWTRSHPVVEWQSEIL